MGVYTLYIWLLTEGLISFVTGSTYSLTYYTHATCNSKNTPAFSGGIFLSGISEGDCALVPVQASTPGLYVRMYECVDSTLSDYSPLTQLPPYVAQIEFFISEKECAARVNSTVTFADARLGQCSTHSSGASLVPALLTSPTGCSEIKRTVPAKAKKGDSDTAIVIGLIVGLGAAVVLFLYAKGHCFHHGHEDLLEPVLGEDENGDEENGDEVEYEGVGARRVTMSTQDWDLAAYHGAL